MKISKWDPEVHGVNQCYSGCQGSLIVMSLSGNPARLKGYQKARLPALPVTGSWDISAVFAVWVANGYWFWWLTVYTVVSLKIRQGRFCVLNFRSKILE